MTGCIAKIERVLVFDNESILYRTLATVVPGGGARHGRLVAADPPTMRNRGNVTGSRGPRRTHPSVGRAPLRAAADRARLPLPRGQRRRAGGPERGADGGGRRRGVGGALDLGAGLGGRAARVARRRPRGDRGHGLRGRRGGGRLRLLPRALLPVHLLRLAPLPLPRRHRDPRRALRHRSRLHGGGVGVRLRLRRLPGARRRVVRRLLAAPSAAGSSCSTCRSRRSPASGCPTSRPCSRTRARW